MNEKIDEALGINPDPDQRVWEYDGDGTKIYKPDQGFKSKTQFPIKQQIPLLFERNLQGRFR